jgi:N-methylhydantoinase B
VLWGKVSVSGARDDYGVVLTGARADVASAGALDGDGAGVDVAASDVLRAARRAARTGDEPFFDRGPGYPTLSGGRTHAEVDRL